MSASGSGGSGHLGEARRRAYLEAMGIPLWLPRHATAPAAGDSAPAEPAPQPEEAVAASAEPDEPVPLERGASASVPEAVVAETAEAEAADAVPGHGGAEGAAPEPGDIAAMDWGTLRDTILGCTRCGLCASRTQAVPGVGLAQADLLVIGEAPGQEEDRQGEPFVGRAGQLLDRMLAAIGLDRSTVFITNVLKCRPPQNRDPAPDEAHACGPYLRRQIELIAPRAILSVGRVSAQNLLETTTALGRLRGDWHRFGPRETPLRVTYHPAYLLRNPAAKRQAWADLKQVRDRLRE